MPRTANDSDDTSLGGQPVGFSHGQFAHGRTIEDIYSKRRSLYINFWYFIRAFTGVVKLQEYRFTLDLFLFSAISIAKSDVNRHNYQTSFIITLRLLNLLMDFYSIILKHNTIISHNISCLSTFCSSSFLTFHDQISFISFRLTTHYSIYLYEIQYRRRLC